MPIVMGTLKEERMVDIWHNERYKRFRSTLFAGRADIPMCTNCSGAPRRVGQAAILAYLRTRE